MLHLVNQHGIHCRGDTRHMFILYVFYIRFSVCRTSRIFDNVLMENSKHYFPATSMKGYKCRITYRKSFANSNFHEMLRLNLKKIAQNVVVLLIEKLQRKIHSVYLHKSRLHLMENYIMYFICIHIQKRKDPQIACVAGAKQVCT